jgi:hypothetical protein
MCCSAGRASGAVMVSVLQRGLMLFLGVVMVSWARRAGGRQESEACTRCGSTECDSAGAGDAARARGGCSGSYSDHDLALVLCHACGRCVRQAAMPPRPDGQIQRPRGRE